MNAYDVHEAALRLRDVDRAVVAKVWLGEVAELDRLGEELRDLKRRSQIAQIEISQLPIASAEAVGVLRQLRDGEPFHIERLVTLRDEADDAVPFDDLSDDEIADL